METSYYVLLNKYRFYTVQHLGSLENLKRFAEFWGVEVFEDLPY